ncbi:MAG: amidohydrolase [Planctomycetota bacterium]|nr:MAG: amidohydrolase [Planctomycetota bacterium]
MSSVLVFLLWWFTTAGVPQEPADLVFLNGKVHTVEWAPLQTQALAVLDGRIVFLGSDFEARLWIGPDTQVVQLDGRSLYPGFQDAHAHLVGLGLLRTEVDLTGTRSYEEVVERSLIGEAALEPGDWLQGRGWDQNDWAVSDFPHHQPLSAAFPKRPVALRRVDGHALLANAAAMAAAGVDRHTEDPPGGRIHRNGEGEPTGVFIDTAMSLILNAAPPRSRQGVKNAVSKAIGELHRRGITAIHDAGVDQQTIALYREMVREGRFDLRNYIMIRGDKAHLDHWLPKGPQNSLEGRGRLRLRSIKLSLDGALGSRGAALLEDYSDAPGERGLLLLPPAYVQHVAERALQSGFQLCVHAIGDRANRLTLDAFEAALQRHPKADHRFRVEHAQILHPDDLPRFAAMGVMASMQAQHQSSDMYWAELRLGSTRVRGAYAWRSLLDQGVLLPGGSDFPVEKPDPMAAFRAAVFRQDGQAWPAGGWYPEQAMTPEEALASLTLWPAKAAFWEDEIGSLAVGKRADLVVLSGDCLQTGVRDLARLQVDLTVFDGRVVFRRR